MKIRKPKVSCIVPAFNEAKTIEIVLRKVTASPLIEEVTVVDDGSTDNTSEVVARKFPSAKLISHPKNQGKANALLTGARAAKNPILFFCDADLIGLEKEHIEKLIAPVVTGKIRMIVGTQEYMNTFRESTLYEKLWKSVKGESVLDEFTKGLGGEKVLFKEDFLSIPDIEGSGYAVEHKIIEHFKKNKIPFEYHVLDGVRHVWKLKKWGLSKGAKKEIKALLTFAKQRVEKKNP